MNAKILVAAHKPYRMPNDPLYCPVFVGAAIFAVSLPWERDDNGENISTKNPLYSELTALYWGWKNLDCDYLGLAHYRRHFSLKRGGRAPWESVLTLEQAETLLNRTNVLLPKKRHYVIETLASHYAHTHSGEHLKRTRAVLERSCPAYLPAFDRVMRRRSGHMFNMFLMKKELADAYCAWLFSVLFALEADIGTEGLSTFDARLFGRIGELLLDVWLEKNQIAYKEIGFVYMESVHWGKKIMSFLKAKFFGKKYEKSF